MYIMYVCARVYIILKAENNVQFAAMFCALCMFFFSFVYVRFGADRKNPGNKFKAMIIIKCRKFIKLVFRLAILIRLFSLMSVVLNSCVRAGTCKGRFPVIFCKQHRPLARFNLLNEMDLIFNEK